MAEITKELCWRFDDLVKNDKQAEIEEMVAAYPEILGSFAVAGATWLQVACKNSSLSTVNKLLELGFGINELDRRGETNALATASGLGDIALVQFLLERGAEANMAESNGNPLISCIPSHVSDTHPVYGKDTPKENYLEIARILIDHGIDTAVRYDMSCGYGLDAKTFAWVWGRHDIARLIAEHEAQGDAELAKQLFAEAKERSVSRSFKGYSKREAARKAFGNRILD